jgi:hypothetical protein
VELSRREQTCCAADLLAAGSNAMLLEQKVRALMMNDRFEVFMMF